MKINQIEIFGFGKLHNLSLTFEQFQVIYGHNEAGKTTIINFIRDILFGFRDNRGKNTNYLPKDGSKLGGKLFVEQAGQKYVIQRTDGKNGGDVVVNDANGKELAEGTLDKLLGPINRDSYNNLFYFGELSLDKIAKLNKDGLAKRIRRVGVVGIDDWINFEDHNNKISGDIYKKTGTKPELNMLLKEHEVLEGKVHDAGGQYDDYLSLTEQRNQIAEQAATNKEEQQKLNNDLAIANEDVQSWERYEQLDNFKKQDIKVKDGFSNKDFEEFQDLTNKAQNLANDVENDEAKIKDFKANNQSDNQQFNFFKNNESRINDLRIQLDNEISDVHRTEQLDRDIENAKKRVARDEDNAGGVDSRPFDSATLQQVNSLVEQLRLNKLSRSSRSNNGAKKPAKSDVRQGFEAIIIGVALIVIGYFTGGVVFLGLSAAGLFSIAYGGFQFYEGIKAKDDGSQDISSNESSVEEQLNKIGQQFKIENKLYDQWTTILQQSIKTRDMDREDLNDLINENERLNQSIINYLDQWDFAKDLIDLDVSQEASQQLNRIKLFISNMQDQDRKADQSTNFLSTLTENHERHLQQLKELNVTIVEYLKKRGVASKEEFDKIYHDQQKLNHDLDKQKELEKSLDDKVIDRLKKYKNKAELFSYRDKLREQVNDSNQKNSDLASQLAELNVQIKSMEENGTFTELNQKLSNLEAEITDLTQKWLVYELTNQWIEKALDEASRGRIPKVQKQAQEFFNLLTGNHYQKIDYNKKDIEVEDGDGVKFAINELSKGTMLQLYLSLIFALTLAFSDEYPMPIIIDDGFVDFDQVRTNKAVELMHKISESTQVLYFTADDRIKDVVNKKELIELV